MAQRDSIRLVLGFLGNLVLASGCAASPSVDQDVGPEGPDAGLKGGFWDSELKIGTWRTDFADPSKGTAANPLTLDTCAYDLATDPLVLNGAGATYRSEITNSQVACDRTSTTYPQSNASTSASTWPMDQFWVVTANNETAYGPEGACSDSGPNTGPPDQSKPIAALGKGVFGVEVSNSKAVLSIDTNHFPNCVSPIDKVKIPFLSFGAQAERGSGKDPITYLNDPAYAETLNFTATLEDLAPSVVNSSTGRTPANYGYVLLEAQWGGKRRWIFIVLFVQNDNAPPFAHQVAHWNWNIAESMWYPGAEIVYMPTTLLSTTCPGMRIVAPVMPTNAGEVARYSINLNDIYECLSRVSGKSWSDPLPSTPVPVTGIHWAIEQTFGKNWTKLSVQDLGLTR